MDANEVTRGPAALSLSATRVAHQSASLTSGDIADSLDAIATTYDRDPLSTAVCVADGMGVRLRVDRGALFVEDGLGEHRRVRRFDKATHGLSRLVILGSTGFITLDALQWLKRLGIGVLVLTPDGTATLASTPRVTDDARLRRMQAMAPELPVGLDLARFLIGRKLSGQASVLRSRFDDVAGADDLAELTAATEAADDLDELRGIEATGASLYWQSWVGRTEAVPHFAAKDRQRVPRQWMHYEGRRSVLASANGNRRAERPANALLSYLYALVEAEAILACHAVGLDAGLGLVHLDARARQSLALDLMEPVRPQVDAFVLEMLGARTFRKVDFHETSDGHCRLKAPLAHEVAESLPQWSRAVAPLAERVAHSLGRAMGGDYKAPTPLTRSRNRAAAAKVKARKAAMTRTAEATFSRQRPTDATKRSAWSCPDCGGAVTDRHRVRCDACLVKDPRQTAELRATRAAAISRRRQAEAEFENAMDGAPYDPDYFVREILRDLHNVQLSAIVAACGVTKSTASNWRVGRRKPHVSHWRALAELTGAGPLTSP